MLQVTGVPRQVLDDNFSLKTATTSVTEDGRVVMKPANELFYEIGDDGVTTIPAGLASKLECVLTGKGYTVRQFNKTRWAILREAWKNLQVKLDDLEEYDAAERTIFATQPRAQFEVRRMDQAAELVVAAARTHRKHTIHVIVKNRRVMKALLRGLRVRSLQRARSCDDVESLRPGDVLVSPTLWFESQVTDDSGLVIFVGEETIRSKAVLQYLEHIGRKPRFAIMMPGTRLTPREKLSIEALVGPVVYRLPE